jgi:hypothetical protein
MRPIIAKGAKQALSTASLSRFTNSRPQDFCAGASATGNIAEGEKLMTTENFMTLYPVVGWEIATLPEGAAMLALRYLPGEPSKPLTTEQAYALAGVHRFAIGAAQKNKLLPCLLA